MRRTRSATLAADPGTRYAYTNTNYHLAGRLVEVVSGQPFAAYLHDHVFAPLGMTASVGIDQAPRDLPPQVRAGYVYAYGATVPVAEPKRFVAGSDGVISTARDLARWLITQSRGGVAADGTRLVSAASAAAMHTPGGPGSTYGMGWDRDEHGWVRHNGVWFTYTASQLLLPSGWGIAVLGNSGLGLANEGTDQLADALAQLVAGGRDITFGQLCHAALPLVLWAAVAAAMNLATLATRVVAVLRLRRPADAATVTGAQPTPTAAG